MTSSMQLAQECLKDPPEASEDPPAPLEGLEMFAQTIETGESYFVHNTHGQSDAHSENAVGEKPALTHSPKKRNVSDLVYSCSSSPYQSHLYRHHYPHRTPAPGSGDRCCLRGAHQTVGWRCSVQNPPENKSKILFICKYSHSLWSFPCKVMWPDPGLNFADG